MIANEAGYIGRNLDPKISLRFHIKEKRSRVGLIRESWTMA